jgi:hypothetical protein
MARSPVKPRKLGTPRHEVGSLEPGEIFDAHLADALNLAGDKDAAGPIAQIKLRLKRAERDWLVEQAKTHNVTLNAEIAARIGRTVGQEAIMTIDLLAENVTRYLQPWLITASERETYGDLVNAAAQLVELILPLLSTNTIVGGRAEAIRAAVRKLLAARRDLDAKAGMKIVSKGTES